MPWPARRLRPWMGQEQNGTLTNGGWRRPRTQEVEGMHVPVRAGRSQIVTERPLSRQLTWWILILPLALIVALVSGGLYLLDAVHVLSGALWTGADLFLGFIVGPVMRRLTPQERKAVITYLVPKTLLYMPVVAFTTGTGGWFLANRFGFLAPTSPNRAWVVTALILTSILTIQGLGILLPNNLRIYRELQRPEPDLERITRLNRSNLRLAGVQGVLQVAVILVMARLVIG